MVSRVRWGEVRWGELVHLPVGLCDGGEGESPLQGEPGLLAAPAQHLQGQLAHLDSQGAQLLLV